MNASGGAVNNFQDFSLESVNTHEFHMRFIEDNSISEKDLLSQCDFHKEHCLDSLNATMSKGILIIIIISANTLQMFFYFNLLEIKQL